MNILSIDVDVFFNGHTFAKHTNFNVSPELNWKLMDMIVTEDREVDLEVDFKSLSKVVDIIENKCKNAKVRYITEHDEIIEVMKEFKCKEATMYNCDDHHDLSYDNDDTTLTIENWVRHAKAKRLIKDYHWIHRPLSDMRYQSSFYHTRTCLDDINVDDIEDIDLVVICLSRHFTPKKYWTSIPNLLFSFLGEDLKHFKEVSPMNIPIKSVENADDYLVDGTLPDVYRVFRNKDLYVVVERDGDVYMSMFSVGGKSNLFTIKEVVDKMLDEYGCVIFDFKKGIRNEMFIKRLVRNYTIIECSDSHYKIGR